MKDALDAVLRSDPERDWGRWEFDERTEYRNKKDASLRIVLNDDERGAVTVLAPWAEKFKDKSVFSAIYHTYYADTRVRSTTLACVDGHRVSLPIPDIGKKRFDPLDYKVAEIVRANGTTTYSLQGYIKRAGFGEYRVR